MARVRVGGTFKHIADSEITWSAIERYGVLSFSAYRARLALIRGPTDKTFVRGLTHALRLCLILEHGTSAKQRGPQTGEQLAQVKVVDSVLVLINETVEQFEAHIQRIRSTVDRLHHGEADLSENDRREAVEFFERLGAMYSDKANEALGEVMQDAWYWA